MFSYQSAYFSIDGTSYEDETILKMQLYTDFVTTSALPHVMSVISATMPSVFDTECFNQANLPFSEEVKNTEIGHLFEHLILAFLRDTKISEGNNFACYDGNTSWDWDTDKYGSFIITIEVGRKEVLMVQKAIEKAIEIVEKLIDSLAATQTGNLSPSYLPVRDR